MAETDADKAYEEIKSRIVTVELPPGAVVREAELMEELGLGRTPIREALQRLQAEKFVVVKPRRGIFVSNVAITDLTRIYEVRVELESLGARLAAERITSEQLARMRKLAEGYQSAETSDVRRYFAIDQAFHRLLAEAAHNQFLAEALQHYYDLSIRIWYLGFPAVTPPDVDVDSHLEIIEALAEGDVKRADETMRRHIEHFHKTVRQLL